MNVTNQWHDSSLVPPRPQPPASVTKQRLPVDFNAKIEENQRLVKKSYYREKSKDGGTRKRSEDFYDEDERITLKFANVVKGAVNM